MTSWANFAISVTFDSRLNAVVADAGRTALAQIDNVCGLSFEETALGGQIAYVLHDEAVDAFGTGEGSQGFEIDVIEGGSVVGAYVAVVDSPTVPLDWLALHETFHAMGAGPGFTDLFFTNPNQTVMSYREPYIASLGSDDIALLQRLYGADAGSNAITGRSAKDTISGGFGDDTLFGSDGADVLYGNQASDSLMGGRGSDTLYGGQGADVVRGDEGSDVLYGNLGDDTLYGGGDLIFGGQGDDVVFARNGDTIHGNLGFDRVELPGAPTSVASDVILGEGYRIDLVGVESASFGKDVFLL